VVRFRLDVLNEPVRTKLIGARGERFLLGLIGAGIGSSASPPLHEAEGEALGLRCLYQLIDIEALGLPAEAVGELLSEARRMGFAGVNVTHPCKQLALDHLDELSPTTRALGAANTVVFDDGRAVGYNTDHSGFSRSFELGLAGVPLGRAVLLGAGGAGTAVAHAALSLGVRELAVVDRDDERAARLAHRLAALFGSERVVAGNGDSLGSHFAGADGLIHATPTGMASHPGVPLPLELLRREMWVADIVYMPLETELLRYARSLGCRTLDGGGMAVFQAAASFQLFTGRQPDAERMLRHFAELVPQSHGSNGQQER
jgi:shikimate dehydrogenase